jgi:hypothetical protein
MSRLWPTIETANDYLNVPASTLWNINTNLVIAAIIRPSNIAGRAFKVMELGARFTRGFAVQIGGAGMLESNKFPLGDASSTVAATLNEWQAVEWRLTSGAATAIRQYRYSNTTLSSGATSETGVYGTPANDGARIGNILGTTASTEAYEGEIDRILIGQGTMSDPEFTALARAWTLPASLTVFGWWLLSPAGTSVSPEQDQTVNNNDLTVTGTTASAAFALPDAVQTYEQVAYRWRANSGSLVAPP